MKQSASNGMKRANVNIDFRRVVRVVLVIVNNVGMMIHAGVNPKN